MAQSLEILLEKTGLSIDEVAQSAGLPLDRVLAIFDGRWLASPSERAAIARVFELSVEDISWGHTMSPRNVRYHRYGIKEEFGESGKKEEDG